MFEVVHFVHLSRALFGLSSVAAGPDLLTGVTTLFWVFNLLRMRLVIYGLGVMTWTSGGLGTMSGLHGDMRWVMPICVGHKSDGLGFSYTVVSCTFLTVLCLLFQRRIQSASMTTRLRQEHSMSCRLVVVDYQTSVLHVFCNYLYYVSSTSIIHKYFLGMLHVAC